MTDAKLLVLFVGFVFVTFTAISCGLYQEPPPPTEVEGLCDRTCGPCDVGRFDCDTDRCEYFGFGSEPPEEIDSCDDVVVVGEDATTVHEAVGSAGDDGFSAVAITGEEVVDEPVVIDDDISLFGIGADARLVVDGESEHLTGVVLDGAEATVGGLTIEVTGGVTNYGARLVEGADVRMGEVVIDVDDGEDGADGVDGASGRRGESGEDGGSPDRFNAGFGGINEHCPDTDGGDGGRGKAGASDAEPGDDSPGGASGSEEDGADGNHGADGADGSDGAEPQIVDGLWDSGSGEPGEDGEHGVGGAGGGGGDADGSDAVGGGGGGGGTGGCGGEGGQGGAAGGASIGVVVADGELQLVDADVSAAAGGDGGVGGLGGDGAFGHGGGSGAVGENSGDSGGDGGRGGDGGDGGDGMGGNSFGVVCHEDNATVQLDSIQVDYGPAGTDPTGEVKAESGEQHNCN